MPGGSAFDEVWPRIAARQAGVVTRQQLLLGGLTADEVKRATRRRDWRTLAPGVYVTFTGPLPDPARVWAAVLAAGEGAMASHRTALWMAGLGERTGSIDVLVSHGRKVRALPGVVVHRTRHPTPAVGDPPRTSVEEAVLDVSTTIREARDVTDLVLRATQRRATTAERILSALGRRPRHRWRQFLHDMFDEVRDGVASVLELDYARLVERAHGLPRAERNRRERTADGRNRYWDVWYVEYDTLVELDGRAYHPDDEAFRELRRDNEAVAQGKRVLRFGHRDVHHRTCEVAIQVASVLQSQGWRGHLRRCSPRCAVKRATG